MHSFPVSLRAVQKVAHGPLHNSETEYHQRYKVAINDKQNYKHAVLALS
jgi:hypothetical protein